MSMSHAFNDVFNDKKKARQWYQKATQAAGTQDYQELEASVYWHVLEQKLKGNPLLAAFKTVLAPGGTVTSEQLDDCTREDKLSEAENAPELLQLTNGLIGFAHYKNLDKRNARLRFIAGILEACYIIFNANDADKVNHWHTLKDILESVKDSHLSDTRAIPDQARSIVGLSESLTHYKTQLVAAVRTAEQIILKEQVIQTKQAIKDDLKNLNSAMKQIPALLPRFIYNVYSDAPVMTLDYHFLYLDQSEHIISLVTVGIQQIIGLPNPTYNLCYEHGKLNERGTKIHALNHILQLLGGKNEVKMNGLAPELPRAEESVLFLRTLREMAQDERLVLSSDGNMVLFARPEAGGNRREICRFPSGFSPEILHTDEEKNCPNDAQKRRQEVVLDYIELLTLTQELQHCFQLNQQYAHYLSQVGELGAFAMMDSTLHEQMELHNKEVAHVLQTKMEEILTDFAVPVEGALGAHTLSKGSDESRRRQAIQEARKIIQNTKRKVATISQQSDAIIRKRKETMQQMKDNKISFYKSLQELLHHYHEFRRLQNLLGRKEVPALSSDAICDMNDKAKKLDDSIRPSSLPTTPMTASHDSEEKEKKEECELAPPYLSPLWTYPPAERKWQYRGFFQFKTARQRLRYYKNDQREAEEKYDPAALLRAYLPQTASKAQKQTESSFGYQIRLRYDVATALKNNMVYPLSFNKVLLRNHGRAARLVLCKEMLAVFEHTVNNELLSEVAIQKMSDQLANHFKAQEEIFNGAFNTALKQIQFNLMMSTQHAILGHATLAQLDAWIENGLRKKHLEEDLKEIEEQAIRLNRFHEYPLLKIKIQQKLEAYLSNESVIAKQLHKIQQEMTDTQSLDELSALSQQLVSLKNTLQTEQYSALAILPAGMDLLKNIDIALEKCIEVQNLKKIEAEEAEERRLVNKQLEKETREEVDAIQSVLEPYARSLELRQSSSLLSSLESIQFAAGMYCDAPATRKYFLEHMEKVINAILADNSREEFDRPKRVYRRALQRVLYTLLDSPLTKGEERMNIVALFDQLDSYIITINRNAYNETTNRRANTPISDTKKAAKYPSSHTRALSISKCEFLFCHFQPLSTNFRLALSTSK